MNILVVDDDVDCCNDLVKFLSRIGHNVFKLYKSEKTAELLKKSKIDIVISDVSMPVLDGIELAKSIKENFPEIKIVLISGLQHIARSINAIDLGIYDFITKPIDLKKLIEIIENIEKNNKRSKENKLDIDEIFSSKEKVISIDKLIVNSKTEFKNKNIEDVFIFSDTMQSLFKKLDKLHQFYEIPVLIVGETGTGKELVAKYLHFESENNNEPFVAINCAAINKEMFEAELFGYEKGAFTGSRPEGRDGFIKLAEKGALFLDEITELTTDTQSKLLRVLQEKDYYRVGGNKKETANTRFIFATNENIEKLVKNGLFREDLYFRLSLCKIIIPPLKERKDEIIPLAASFIKTFNKKFNKNISKIEVDALKFLYNYYWPGNIRELKNTITQMIIFNETDIITSNDIKLHESTLLNENQSVKTCILNAELPEEPFELETFIDSLIRKTLEKFNGNKTKASEYLGISRMKLYNRYKGHL